MFDIVHSPSLWAIVGLGLLLLALFATWLAVAHAIFAAYFGQEPTALGAFVRRCPPHRKVKAPSSSATLSASIALVAFSISVVSFPLLLDRHVGMSVAIITPIRTISGTPDHGFVGLLRGRPAGNWRPAVFIGLAVVMPVLAIRPGTYRKASSRIPVRGSSTGTPKGKRYAADFPVALFTPWGRIFSLVLV
jgi:uncharacterized membrane protein